MALQEPLLAFSVSDTFPPGQHPVGAEGQAQVFARRNRADRLADTHRTAATIKSGANSKGKARTVFDEPFGHSRAVVQPGRFVGRSFFRHRLIVAEVADAAVPIHPGPGSAADEQPTE